MTARTATHDGTAIVTGPDLADDVRVELRIFDDRAHPDCEEIAAARQLLADWKPDDGKRECQTRHELTREPTPGRNEK
jgi:hypothetical protein